MTRVLRRTKIIATLGPASDTPETIAQMIQAGMDVARFNLSHGSEAEHRARLANLEEAVSRCGDCRVGVLFDLRGPEIRLETFAGGSVTLVDGQLFTVTTERVLGGPDRVGVDFPRLPEICRPGDRVLLDDGNLALEVVEVRGPEVVCRVKAGGTLGDRKKINLPGRANDMPYLSPKDERDLKLAVEVGADFVAASYTRHADDIALVRQVLQAHGGRQMIIAKIECQEALDNLEAIIGAADAIMVARGDLGVEVPEEDVPVIQKDIIARALRAGRPVITATQMLESMVARPHPTRAEASDVANAIFDGTDAIMLSAESAVGRFPVEAVRTMTRIALRTERAISASAPGRYRPWAWEGRDYHAPTDNPARGLATITGAISLATVTIAVELRAGAIVTATSSGHTARMVARHRPLAPIIAVTSSEVVARQQTLVWGVLPVLVPEAADTDEMFLRASAAARQSGIVEPGSSIVITAGAPPGTPGSTNIIKVVTLGQVLGRGSGHLPVSATGRVRVCRTPGEALRRLEPGDILVARGLDASWLEAMRLAAAWVVEEAGSDSFAAVQGRGLGRAAITGVAGALELLRDGDMVTLDGARGLIYEGRASVL